MPDRLLKPEEMAKFLQEKATGKLGFNALEWILEEKTEPTLHDLAIHELHAIVAAFAVTTGVHKELIIQLGRAVNELKERIETLEAKR